MSHITDRIDISEWIIHFVHERKPENDITTLQKEYEMEGGTDELRYPDYWDAEGRGENLLSFDEENEYRIPEDASAFQVLLKILHDGYLHSGWSYRGDKPTIYGPRSAVCFTEMPLHAYIKYAEDRGRKTGLISKYALALKRKEIFRAGGRPVIYGLSLKSSIVSKNTESEIAGSGVFQGRCLSVETTGLGLWEQYRYVTTSLGGDRTIDWTHEREWRWPLLYDYVRIPGLPLYLDGYDEIAFSEIRVFVDTIDEKKVVLDFLKTLYDSGSWDNGIEYDISLVKKVQVISFEEIAQSGNIDISKVKVENLPFSMINTMPVFSVSPQTQALVEEKLNEAQECANVAMQQFVAQYPQEANRAFDYGWTYVCTKVVSEITQALIFLGFSSYADGIYRKNIISGYHDSLTTQRVGAEAAAEYLSKELNQSFFVMCHED